MIEGSESSHSQAPLPHKGREPSRQPVESPPKTLNEVTTYLMEPDEGSLSGHASLDQMSAYDLGAQAGGEPNWSQWPFQPLTSSGAPAIEPIQRRLAFVTDDANATVPEEEVAKVFEHERFCLREALRTHVDYVRRNASRLESSPVRDRQRRIDLGREAFQALDRSESAWKTAESARKAFHSSVGYLRTLLPDSEYAILMSEDRPTEPLTIGGRVFQQSPSLLERIARGPVPPQSQRPMPLDDEREEFDIEPTPSVAVPPRKGGEPRSIESEGVDPGPHKDTCPGPIVDPNTVTGPATLRHNNLRSIPKALKEFNEDSLREFQRALRFAREEAPELNRSAYISQDVASIIELYLASADEVPVSNPSEWESWDDSKFFRVLLDILKKDARALDEGDETRFLVSLGKVHFHLYQDVAKTVMEYLVQINKVLLAEGYLQEGARTDKEGDIPEGLLKEAFKRLAKGIEKGTSFDNNRNLLTSLATRVTLGVQKEVPRTAHDYIKRVKHEILEARKAIKRAHELTGGNKPREEYSSEKKGNSNSTISKRARSPPRFDRHPNKRRDPSAKPGPSADRKPPPHSSDHEEQRCQGCGKRHLGGREACHLKSHPDFNKVGNWAESDTGLFYKRMGMETLQKHLVATDRNLSKYRDNLPDNGHIKKVSPT